MSKSIADLWQIIASGKLKPGISAAEVRKLLPKLRIANDSDTSHWDKKAKAFAKRTLYATTDCRVARLECRAELTFYDQKLYEIKLKAYGNRSEALYGQMCEAYTEACGVLSGSLPAPVAPPRPWAYVSELVLAASGLPNDRYEELALAAAASGLIISVYFEWETCLAFSVTWSEPSLYIYR